MAWKDALLDASFRGVRFDCVSTGDEAPRATAEHTYPYRDGADIEDLGRQARKMSVDAVFFGTDYESRLQTFIKALDEHGAADLIHPVFGLIKAQVMSYRIAHQADDVDQARVTVEFGESTPGNPFFERSLPAQKAAAINQFTGTARLATADSLVSTVQGIAARLGEYGRIAALRDTLTSALNTVKSFTSGFVSSGLDPISYPRAWVSDVSGAVSGVVNSREWSSPTLMADWRATTGTLRAPVTLPDVGINTAAANDARYVAAHIDLEKALTAADAAAVVFNAETQTTTLTPREIEAVLGETRGLLQAGLASYRALYPLEQSRTVTEPIKQTAFGLQEAALAIIEAHPPLIAHTVGAPQNLHLLAHRLYGDYRRAPQLLRLNPRIRQPNKLTPGDTLNVYAR